MNNKTCKKFVLYSAKYLCRPRGCRRESKTAKCSPNRYKLGPVFLGRKTLQKSVVTNLTIKKLITVQKLQKKAQPVREYTSCPNASTVPTQNSQKSHGKHKHNACKEPWPQDEKHESSKISFLKQNTRIFLIF